MGKDTKKFFGWFSQNFFATSNIQMQEKLDFIKITTFSKKTHRMKMLTCVTVTCVFAYGYRVYTYLYPIVTKWYSLGKTGKIGGNSEVFHIINRVFHRERAVYGYLRISILVNIIILDRFRQTSYFFALRGFHRGAKIHRKNKT